MANTKTFNGSFVGGELSPEMFGRIDDAKFRSGASSIENMIVTPLGPAEKRPGFAYVNTTKNNGPARLIPFTYSVTQTMVIEIGEKYFRFHTMGKTLQYSTAGLEPWVANSPGDVTYTLTTPAVLTWTASGLVTGDPVRFYAFGASPQPPLPVGLQLGYTYTAQVIDANTFTLLDQNGLAVAFSSGGPGPGTTYTGTGTTTGSVYANPSQSSNATSPTLTGLASTVVSGGLATLAASIQTSIDNYGGTGHAYAQYSTDGVNWNTFDTAIQSSPSTTQTVSVSIPIANLNQLRLRVTAGCHALPSGSIGITMEILTWSATIPTTTGPTTAEIRGYSFYDIGDVVTYGGSTYSAVVADTGGMTVPGTDPTVWNLLPADLSYEVASPYLASDIKDIHYVQSADVVTLVHPNYPPAELRRLGATHWTYTPIVFTQKLPAPASVAITPTLGYKARISTIGLTTNPLITTAANHLLALGDGVYISGLTANLGGGVTKVLDGFWMVSLVPADGTGKLIPNELFLEDYSGNALDASSWTSYTSGATLQYGTQIVDITNTYVVTAVAPDAIQQSATSTPVSVLNNLYVTGSFNTITWNAVPGAHVYYIYKQRNGLYGYIGQTPGLSFSDTNIAPDMGITPAINDPVFQSATNYPGAVSYYQQRRIFAGTLTNPQNLWMTKTGTESDISYSIPVQATDRIAIAIATREMSTILHVIPLLQLILLTNSCEISASPSNGDAITPQTISARPQSYVGSTNVAPAVVNNAMLFCAARGGHIREMGYQWQNNGYVTADVSLRAAHLFDGFSIVDQAFMKAPWQVVWYVSSSGNLLGFTYIPEEQVGAWHHHVTDGTFQSVAVVSEGQEDHLYAIITRKVNGASINCVERMGSRLYGASQQAFFVDCGGTFDGTNLTATTVVVSGGTTWGPADTLTLTSSTAIFAAADPGSVVVLTGADGVTIYRFTVKTFTSSTVVVGVIDKVLEAGLHGVATAVWAWARPIITGLTWLVGKTVNVLVDGAVQPQCVVQADGSITLQRAGVVVQAGLPYTAEIDSLPIALMQIPGAGQGTQKNINKVYLKLFMSGSVFAGPGPLVEYKQRTVEAYGTPPALMSKEIEIVIPPVWTSDGTITVSQSDPLPLTVVGITYEVSVGG